MSQSANDTLYRDSLNTPLIRTKQPGPDAWWKRRWLMPSLVATFLVVTSFMAVSYVKAAGAIQKIGCIRCLPNGASYVGQPTGVTVDSAGNLYMVNRDSRVVQKFDAAGNLLLQYGVYGSGDGQFDSPVDVAVDSSGNTYITDYSNRRVQKFNSTGNYVSQFGVYGNGNGQFGHPTGIALDTAGNIYVADNGNDRIQKFNANGVYQAQWGSYGSGNGQFSDLQDIALDSAGNLYAADSGNYRIQKFNTSGMFVSEFGVSGYGNGQLIGAYGVAVDSSNNIYVADTGNNRVQKFNASGAYQTQWGSSHSSYGDADGEMNAPYALAVDSSGSVYVADTYNNRAQKFTNTGGFLLRFGTPGVGPYGGWLDSYANGEFSRPGASAFDSSGNIYVVEPDSNRVQKFSSSGSFLRGWHSASYDSYGRPYGGSSPGEFDYPVGVSVDTNDNFYVVDYGNSRVQKFDANGDYVMSLGNSFGSADGQFKYPQAVANDLAGNVYVADTGNNRIQKFASDGTYLAKADAAFPDSEAPAEVSVDSDGNVWTLDSNNLYKYSSNLSFINSWEASQGGALYNQLLTTDKQGHVYLAQYGGQGPLVAKFDLAGNQLDTWTLEYTVNSYIGGVSTDSSQPGRLAVSLINQNQVLFLCDTNVSTNNCSSATPTPTPTPTPDAPHGGGGGDGATTTYFYPNTSNSTVTYLTLTGSGAPTNGSLSETKYANLPKDGSNLFPAGLSSFQFSVSPGATTQVALYYNLPGKPSNYTARKYNPSTQAYTDISGATITREDYSGTSMLKLTYNLTDNGILDLDPTAGHVVDPVGLATTSLANTGENIWVIALGALVLLTAGSGLVIVWRKWGRSS